MLTISPNTFACVAAVDLDRFVKRVCLFLRDNAPGMADEPLDRMYAQVLLLRDEAASYGMTSERAVAGYALAAALLGLDFADRFGGAREILFSGRDQHDKAELLSAFTVTLFETLGRGR